MPPWAPAHQTTRCASRHLIGGVGRREADAVNDGAVARVGVQEIEGWIGLQPD